jgi:hypothetical protein
MQHSKICCFISDSIFLAVFITVFIFNMVIYKKLDNSDSIYTVSLAKNWVTTPIVDLQQGPLCTSNYTTLIFDSWPGTTIGHIKDGNLSRGFCSSDNDKLKNCKDIIGFSYKNINNWFGTSFCVRRLPIASYLESSIASPGSSCPINMKNCGILDSLGNSLCVLVSIECPINDIQIVLDNSPVPSGYKSLRLVRNGQVKKMIFGNSGVKGKIVNEFKISEDTPCINPYYHNRKVNSFLLDETFNKDRCLSGYGGKNIDENYKKIDSYSINDLYYDNNIQPKLKNVIDSYPEENLRATTNLYYRNNIGISKKCFDEIKRDVKFKNIQNGIIYLHSDYRNHQKNYLSVFMFIFIGYMFVFFVYYLVRIPSIFADISKSIILVFELITTLLIIISAVLFVVYYSKMITIMSYYKDFLPYTNNCGDSVYSEAVPKFINIMNSAYSNLIICIVLTFMMIPIPFLKYFVQLFTPFNPEQKSEQELKVEYTPLNQINIE